MVGRLVGLVGWLVWLVGWLVGRLVGWLSAITNFRGQVSEVVSE